MSVPFSKSSLGRRGFLRTAGAASLGFAATSLALSSARAQSTQSLEEAQTAAQSKDSVKDIFTAALIAEDLATTFYYNALVGPVITDPNLAGPGGTALNVTSAGNFGNVAYIRAALTEEVSHAAYFRAMLQMPKSSEPVHTFYFPAGSFDTLAAFTGLLNALENAFIGAYLNAIQEFGTKASRVNRNGTYIDVDGSTYSGTELAYLAKVAASIMGVECEHRTLGRVISNTNPANNVIYEQTDGLNAVYTGTASAVAALTPFLTPSFGPAFSWDAAATNSEMVSEAATAFVPPQY